MSERVEAAAKAYFENAGDCTYRDAFRLTLAAADEVMFSEAAIERAAKATYAEGAFCGTCEFEGWDSCADCRRCNMDYARAVVAALREGA
jgi:hypothetical protein